MQTTSYNGYYSLRLPKIITDGNGVGVVFNKEKDGILKPSYEGR